MQVMRQTIKGLVSALLLTVCISAFGQNGIRKEASSEAGNAPASNRFEVRKDKDNFLEGRNYKGGSVWIVLFVKVLPGQDKTYFNYLADVWKKQQELLRQEGVILSYKVMQTNQIHKGDFNVVLMTEYESRASIDENQGKLDTVVRKVTGTDQVTMAAYREREKVRTFFGGKIMREVIFR